MFKRFWIPPFVISLIACAFIVTSCGGSSPVWQLLLQYHATVRSDEVVVPADGGGLLSIGGERENCTVRAIDKVRTTQVATDCIPWIPPVSIGSTVYWAGPLKNEGQRGEVLHSTARDEPLYIANAPLRIASLVAYPKLGRLYLIVGERRELANPELIVVKTDSQRFNVFPLRPVTNPILSIIGDRLRVMSMAGDYINSVDILTLDGQETNHFVPQESMLRVGAYGRTSATCSADTQAHVISLQPDSLGKDVGTMPKGWCLKDAWRTDQGPAVLLEHYTEAKHRIHLPGGKQTDERPGRGIGVVGLGANFILAETTGIVAYSKEGTILTTEALDSLKSVGVIGSGSEVYTVTDKKVSVFSLTQ